MAFESVSSSLSSRAELWINSAHAWLDKPWFGHGAGGFDHAYAPHRAAHVEWLGSNTILSLPSSDAGAAHNEPLQFLIQYGVVGFAAACLLGWLMWRPGTKAFIWVLLPMSLIGFPFQNPASAVVIAVGLGLMCRKDSRA